MLDGGERALHDGGDGPAAREAASIDRRGEIEALTRDVTGVRALSRELMMFRGLALYKPGRSREALDALTRIDRPSTSLLN